MAFEAFDGAKLAVFISRPEFLVELMWGTNPHLWFKTLRDDLVGEVLTGVIAYFGAFCRTKKGAGDKVVLDCDCDCNLLPSDSLMAERTKKEERFTNRVLAALGDVSPLGDQPLTKEKEDLLPSQEADATLEPVRPEDALQIPDEAVSVQTVLQHAALQSKQVTIITDGDILVINPTQFLTPEISKEMSRKRPAFVLECIKNFEKPFALAKETATKLANVSAGAPSPWDLTAILRQNIIEFIVAFGVYHALPPVEHEMLQQLTETKFHPNLSRWILGQRMHVLKEWYERGTVTRDGARLKTFKATCGWIVEFNNPSDPWVQLFRRCEQARKEREYLVRRREEACRAEMASLFNPPPNKRQRLDICGRSAMLADHSDDHNHSAPVIQLSQQTLTNDDTVTSAAWRNTLGQCVREQSKRLNEAGFGDDLGARGWRSNDLHRNGSLPHKDIKRWRLAHSDTRGEDKLSPSASYVDKKLNVFQVITTEAVQQCVSSNTMVQLNRMASMAAMAKKGARRFNEKTLVSCLRSLRGLSMHPCHASHELASVSEPGICVRLCST